MKLEKLLTVLFLTALFFAMNVLDAQAAKTLKIGVVMPLSGQLSLDGTHEANGVKLAVEDINARGGFKVSGETYKIELLVYDDQGVPKESVAAMEKLVTRDGVKMVVGAYTSSSTFAIMPIAQREKVILCSPNSAAAKLTQVGNKWFFRGGVTTPGSLKTITQWVQKLGFQTMAHVAINDDWGRGVASMSKEAQEKVGIKVLTQELYDHGTSDFYSILTKIKGLKPNAIGTGMETKALSILARQAREVCPEIPIIDIGVGADPYQMIRLAPEAVTHMHISSRGPGLDDPKIAPLVKRYRAKYNVDPMSYVLSGYDVMMIYKNAMERAGTVSDTEKIREAMTKTDYHGLIGHYYFDKNNENSLGVWIGDYKGGKVNLYPFKP